MAVALACKFLDQALASWNSTSPLVLGISGPQGSGKLYLADHILLHLNTRYPQLTSVGILIDDFYLTNAEQRKVSAEAKKEDNQVLQGRGLPGTHDLDLALNIMDQLCSGKAPVLVPIYDKSAFGGEGDRLPETQWQKIDKPVDVVVFEGWFNGYKSIDPEIFPTIYLSQDPSGIVQRHRLYHLEEINLRLRAYEELWRRFNYFVYLKTDKLDNVYRWRLEQEAHLLELKGEGMNPVQVRAFVDRYMPVYHLYYERLGDVAEKDHNLEICINENRIVEASRVV